MFFVHVVGDSYLFIICFYLFIYSKRALDLDVVDTTDLQDNMHAVRHSAFNVNRIILEVIFFYSFILSFCLLFFFIFFFLNI